MIAPARTIRIEAQASFEEAAVEVVRLDTDKCSCKATPMNSIQQCPLQEQTYFPTQKSFNP